MTSKLNRLNADNRKLLNNSDEDIFDERVDPDNTSARAFYQSLSLTETTVLVYEGKL